MHLDDSWNFSSGDQVQQTISLKNLVMFSFPSKFSFVFQHASNLAWFLKRFYQGDFLY